LNGQRRKCKSRGILPKRLIYLRPILTMRKFLIPLVGFAFVCTARATVDDDQRIAGLPVTVVSSGRTYKVFEQYPWEGHSSNYGPKGNRLTSGCGVGVGKNICHSLQVRHGDWIHMPDVGWRQINESSSRGDGIEFFASYRDEYKGKHLRMEIDKVVFALPSQRSARLPFGRIRPTPPNLDNPAPGF
jgi:hypothetical protein